MPVAWEPPPHCSSPRGVRLAPRELCREFTRSEASFSLLRGSRVGLCGISNSHPSRSSGTGPDPCIDKSPQGPRRQLTKTPTWCTNGRIRI